jgi:adenylate kinase family enzyme
VEARRIQVRGSSGSGKTTVAAELARRLGAPHVELDALVHGPGWTQATDEELRARLEPLLDEPAWVVDGNYTSRLGTLVSDRADLVVWLDLPLRVSLSRALRRSVARIRDGSELWNGNRQTWRGAFWGRDSLLVYSLRNHRRTSALVERTVPAEKLVRLRSSEEARTWLDGVAR